MIALMYRSFGREAPTGMRGWRLLALGLAALVFVASSLLMLAVFNFFALFLGVFVNFLGRDGIRFTFIHLFRRIPIIGIAPLVLLAYATRQNARLHDAWELVMMPVVTVFAALLLIGGAIAINTMLSGRRGG